MSWIADLQRRIPCAMELTPDFQKSYTENAAETSVKLAKIDQF